MKKIDKIKDSKFARGFFALKSSVKLIPQTFNLKNMSPDEIFNSLIGPNTGQFIDEIGALKGSILKAAQLLSSYAEYYLPKETNLILRKILNQSQYVDYENLKKSISINLLEKIEISSTPLAAASIGQVHRGRVKDSGEEVVLKIQYPGVRKAIDIDIFILKKLVSLLNILPRKIDLSDVFKEIKKVLIDEMDYIKEASTQEEYAQLHIDVSNVYVPSIYKNLCTSNVIVSEYIPGTSLADIDECNMSQEKRNILGEKIISLYFFEIFRGGIVQTDCHAGNFIVRQIDNSLELVLIDFGACIKFDESIFSNYRAMLKALYFKDNESFTKLIHILMPEYSEDQNLVSDIWEYLLIATSPLHSLSFDWGKTTLPDQLFEKGKKFIEKSSIEKPPHSFIFLDRKIIGVFSILRQIKAEVEMKKIVDKYIS